MHFFRLLSIVRPSFPPTCHQVIELHTEVEQRCFDVAHSKVVLSEKENVLTRGGLQTRTKCR